MRIASCGLLLLLAGCSGGAAQGSRPDVGGSYSGVPMQGRIGIPEEMLEEVGFKEIWTYHHNRPVEQSWFLEGDLYLTSPAEEGYSLIKVNGETGLPEWTYPISGKLEFRPEAYQYPRELRAANHEELFIIENGKIYCLDDRYGAENYHISCNFPISTPVTAGQEYLFVGSWNKRVYALEKQGSLEKWTYITDAPITAPVEVGGVNVYFGSEDAYLYALNQGGGFLPGKSWDVATGGKIVARPLHYQDKVFIGSWDYKVYCFEDLGPEPFLRWSYPTGAPITSPLFPFRDWIFAITEDNRGAGETKWNLLAFDQGEGTRLWAREGVKHVLAADGLHLYVLDENRQFHALRHEDGKTDWTMDVSGFQHVIGQDAGKGSERQMWGRIYLIGPDGLVQAIRPGRR